MTEETNKYHQVATELFANECKKRFGIKPIDDDYMILDAAVQFNSYIKTFKRLDLNTAWHRKFIDTMVKIKVDTLDKRIIQKYGIHKEYLDRMQRKHISCKEKDARISMEKKN